MKAVALRAALGMMLACASASMLANPLCEKATFAEVQAVVGGSISKLDVIDEPDMSNLSCVYLDTQDLYNGLTIQFITDERLKASKSRWSTAKAYFEEWTGGGDGVSGVGEGAAWSSLTNSLYALRGSTVIQLSSGKADIADAAVRARFEALAAQILGKLQ